MHTMLRNTEPSSDLENQIPNNKPRAQAHGAPEDRLRGAPPLRGALELPVPPADVLLRRGRVGDELFDVLFLRG